MNALSKKLIQENKYTFGNYDVDSRNRFAYLVAVEVANTPDTPFNPLLLYGNKHDENPYAKGNGMAYTCYKPRIQCDLYNCKRFLL